MLKKWEFRVLFVTVISLFLTLGVSMPTYAKGPGMDGSHGRGGSHGMGKGAISGKGETQGTTESALPSGLAKEGKMPYGLEKQDKTPVGWSKGKKKGWKNHTKKEDGKENVEAEKHEKEKE